MKLIQKKGFLKKEFELSENILKIKTKSPAETKEWTEKIEYVGEELVYQSKSKAVANVFAYIYASGLWHWLPMHFLGMVTKRRIFGLY